MEYRKVIKKKNRIRKEIGEKLSPLLLILTLPPSQGFFSRETDFYLHQFFSNFFKYFSSNFPPSHPYSNFAIYFPGSSFLLYFSASGFLFISPSTSIFSCCLTFTFNLLSNLSINSFAFSKSSPFSHVLFSAMNPFQCTKYLSTPCIFLLFNIFWFPTLPFLLLQLAFFPLSSVLTLAPCTLLFGWHLLPDGFSSRWVIIVWLHWSIPSLLSYTALHISLLTFLLVFSWIPNLWYSTAPYLLSSKLPFLFFLYPLVSSCLPRLSSMLPQLSSVLSSSFLQIQLLFPLFLSF